MELTPSVPPHATPLQKAINRFFLTPSFNDLAEGLNDRKSLLFKLYSLGYRRAADAGYRRNGHVEIYGELFRYAAEKLIDQNSVENEVNLFLNANSNVPLQSIFDFPSVSLAQKLLEHANNGKSVNIYLGEHNQSPLVSELRDVSQQTDLPSGIVFKEIPHEIDKDCVCDLMNVDNKSYVMQVGDQLEIDTNNSERVEGQLNTISRLIP